MTTAHIDTAHPQPARGRRASRVQLTDRDRELLEFVAAHRFVYATHVRDWLGVARSLTYRRLQLLTDAGLLRYERIFHAQPGVFMITNGGLAVIDSRLPRPTIDLRLYRHEAQIPALYLIAAAGIFGPAAVVRTERQIVHHDTNTAYEDDPSLSVLLGGYDRAGRPRRHSPDLLIDHPDGKRTAIELELSLKGRRRLEDIIRGYDLEDQITHVVYLTDQRQIANAVTDVASATAPGKVTVACVQLPLVAPMVEAALIATRVGWLS